MFFQSFNDALSSFLTYSDLDFIYNYLLDGEPSDFDNHIRYVEAAKTRKALHVGNTFFADTSEAVYDAMENDIPKSVAPELEDLLNAKYRVTN